MSDTINVTWECADGQRITAAVPLGYNLMEAAVSNGVPGISGDCGGALACATCHVTVVSSPVALDQKSATETDMLDFAEVPATSASRLSCQIRAVPDLDGLVLRIPGN